MASVGKSGGESSGALTLTPKTTTTPAANTLHITVDTHGLKPQDDTAAV